jgi:hypothetical protein
MLVSNPLNKFDEHELITFLSTFFKHFFWQIWNQREILRFLIPMLNFFKEKLFSLISIFSKLGMQIRTRRFKKMENLFYKHVLEFN